MSRMFKPVASATLSATTTSSAAALPGTFTAAQHRSVRLYNAGPSEVFAAFGASTVVATTGDMVIPPGAIELFEPDRSATHIAGIVASGAATLRITTGEGE